MKTIFNKKLSLPVIASTLLLLVSASATASIIGNSDIESINIFTPNFWEESNQDLLFDGDANRFADHRFVAYQNNGQQLSDSNPLTISVALTNDVDIDSISFFNDWRNYLNQQVISMDVSLFNENDGILWSSSYSNLKTNAWDEINLVNFTTPIFDVKKIDFSITGSQGNHFEIREFLVNTNTDGLSSSIVEVQSPTVIALFAIAIGAFFHRRLSKK